MIRIFLTTILICMLSNLSYAYNGNILGKLHNKANGADTFKPSYKSKLIRDNQNLLQCFNASVDVYIPTPYPIDSLLCTGDNLTIPVRTLKTYNGNNQFSVQLSDASGNFTSGVFIGSKTASTNCDINCVIPVNTLQGNAYRIRVISSSPIDTSYDNNYNLTISNYPTPTASNNGPVCTGDTLRLTVSSTLSGLKYTWSGPIPSTNGQTIIVFNARPADAGTYIVTANNKSCTATTSTTVVIKPIPPRPSANSDGPKCSGGYIQLSGTSPVSGVNYKWRNTQGFYAATQNPLIQNVDGTHDGYFFLQTVLNGCNSEEDTINIEVISTPFPKLSANYPICENSQLVVTANDTVYNATYSWQGPFGIISNTQKITIAQAQLNHSGKYIVRADNRGCKNADSIDVVVNPLPGKIIASNNSPICANDTLLLYASDTSTNVSYTWTGPDGHTSTDKNAAVPNADIGKNGKYIITASRNGCTADTTTDVTIKPLPETPKASSNSPVYLDELIKLQLLNPLPGAAFQWEGPDNFQSAMQNPMLAATTNAAGSYTILTTLNGCSTSSITIVQVNEKEFVAEYKLFPNPNNGDLFIVGPTQTDAIAKITITDAIGKSLTRTTVQPKDKLLNAKIHMAGRLSPGIYFLQLMIEGRTFVFKYTVVR